MTTPTDLSDSLNLIKLRIRYFEWKLTVSDSDDMMDDCFEGLREIINHLQCILNVENLSSRDRTTAIDYLLIINNIIEGNE